MRNLTKDESEIQDAIDYEISPITTEVLWETQQDTDNIDIYDEHYNELSKENKIG